MAQTAVAVAWGSETAMEAAPNRNTKRKRIRHRRRKRDIFWIFRSANHGSKGSGEMGNGVCARRPGSLPDSNFETWQTQPFPLDGDSGAVHPGP